MFAFLVKAWSSCTAVYKRLWANCFGNTSTNTHKLYFTLGCHKPKQLLVSSQQRTTEKTAGAANMMSEGSHCPTTPSWPPTKQCWPTTAPLFQITTLFFSSDHEVQLIIDSSELNHFSTHNNGRVIKAQVIKTFQCDVLKYELTLRLSFKTF